MQPRNDSDLGKVRVEPPIPRNLNHPSSGFGILNTTLPVTRKGLDFNIEVLKSLKGLRYSLVSFSAPLTYFVYT